MGFIKKLDKMIGQSFVGPFLVTFMIALFILVMQTLWVYIDDIAGKGVGLLLLVELLAYRSVSLIPLALPIAVLISSVMVMGNMGERYELSSIKSAGISLLRIMRPLLFMGFLAALFSYYCGVYLIPVSNLKFGARMYDISHKKPTLRLQEGVFNDDFSGYSIHIGAKGGDGRSISDVLIYDHKEANRGKLGVIVAEKGEMFSTEDGAYFIMKLENGTQYIELEAASNRKYPFITTSFDTWTKVFDLGEFQLRETNEELFKENRSMLSINELADRIDTLALRVRKVEVEISNILPGYLHFLEMDSTFIEPRALTAIEKMVRDSSQALQAEREATDSLRGTNSTALLKPQRIPSDTIPEIITSSPPKDAVRAATRAASNRSQANYNNPEKLPKQLIEKPLEDYDQILELFEGKLQQTLLSRSKNMSNTIRRQAEANTRRISTIKEDRVKHIYDLHTKYSMAIACFIFMFIGAPMGAIVRKGGFGYPLLVAIFFFTMFVVLTIFCRKVAESFVLPAAMAAWMPCFVLLPLGLFLTYKAMNDSKMKITIGIPFWFKYLSKRS